MTNDHQSSSSVALPEQLKELLHSYEALCKKLEELPNTPVQDVDAAVNGLKNDFNALPALPEEFAELISKRFANAEKAAQLFKKEIEERSAVLRKLIETADAVISAGELATAKEVESIEKKLVQYNSVSPDAEVSSRLEKLAPLLAALKEEQAAELERVKKCDELISRLEALEASEDFAAVKEAKEEVKKEYDAIGNLPAASIKRYNDAIGKIRTKLNQHYETLDLARWESYTRRLDLLSEIEKLASISDEELKSAAAKLNELRIKWKECGSVPNEKKEEVNTRFLELTRPLQRRIDDYYSNLRQAKKAAAEQKLVMCATAEALADSTSWKVSSEQFKAMQADWKQLPHTGSTEKELFTRFRAAADKFFSARDAFFKERNSRIDAAKSAKEALIAKVSELDPADRRGAKQLREEFKATANAGKFELDLRKQFDAAMDAFFSALRENAVKNENRSCELVRELESLASDPMAGSGRAKEIMGELEGLKVRSNAKKERDAINNFNRAKNKARVDANLSNFAEFKQIILALGANPAEKPAGIEKFSRLESAYELLNASDEESAKKLDKLVSHSRKTASRIIDELKGLVGAPEEEALSLSQQLEAAILGNFARNEAEKSRKAKFADVEKLRTDFMTIYLPAEEFTAAAEEFESLFKQIPQER